MLGMWNTLWKAGYPKTKDPLNDNLLSLLSSSQNDIISKLFPSQRAKNLLVLVWKPTSPTKKLRNQLGQVPSRLHHHAIEKTADNITKSTSFYPPTFCSLYNSKQREKSETFNRRLILDQLRCNGVLEVLDLPEKVTQIG
ncbi:BTE_HP_G0020380.mRNA.1.CDS.1 [Saccharomyces cerevisiae]|nr:BTE_HP_G0020380.mRNA.1.CDS.1 [Saccharomyces cerevisiae]CAI6601697.1 BTE_HP_G0020380.mRNA.1.CDS.1 [Saccharomyces cerevisiae]